MSKKSILLLLLSLSWQFITAQVTGVDYKLKFNEERCTYDVYLVINSGSGSGPAQTIQSSSQLTIVTPHGVSVSVDTTYNPKIGNWPLGTGTQPAGWDQGNQLLAPTVNPTKDFYAFKPDINPVARYDALQVGDEVRLMSLNITPLPHGINGVRLFENGVDPGSEAPGMGGADYSNGFTIGSSTQRYEANEPTEGPEEHITTDSQFNVLVDDVVELVSNSAGTWESLDNDVAEVNGEMLTGIGTGNTMVVMTPFNGGCQEGLQIGVQALENENILHTGVGTYDPHMSAILDVSATDRGVLLPRLTLQNRTDFDSPVDGVILFQIDGSQPGFHYYEDGAWKRLDDMSGSCFTIDDDTSDSLAVDNNEEKLQNDIKQMEDEFAANQLLINQLKKQLSK